MGLRIIEEAVIKNTDGLIDVFIFLLDGVHCKPYKYTITSENDYWEFKKLCKNRKYGKALNFIKKNSLLNKENNI